MGSFSKEVLDPEQEDRIVQHTLPGSPAWTPDSIEINSRKGRQSVCVVAKDRAHYRVYDLESIYEEKEAREDRNYESDDSMP